MILTRVAHEAESATAAANFIMFPMMFLSGSFFPLEMMPGFLQTIARILPLYYVNEGLRAAMVLADHARGAAGRRDDRRVRGRGLRPGRQDHPVGGGRVTGSGPGPLAGKSRSSPARPGASAAPSRCKLAAAGCDVAVNYYNSHDEAEAVCAEIRAAGRRACAIQGSVGKSGQRGRALRRVRASTSTASTSS